MIKLNVFTLLVCLFISNPSYAEKKQEAKVEEISSPHPNLKLTLNSCIVSKKTATIEGMLTNESNIDANIYLYGGGNSTLSAVVYDDQGNRYENVTVSLGGGKSGKIAEGVLPSEVPVKLRIEVQGVGNSIDCFTRINLMLSCSELKITAGKQYFKINKLTINKE